MADPKGETFPMIPDNQWWTLRKRFKQSVPTSPIDANYLSTVLGVNEKTAKSTVLSNLKRVGLLDKEGRAGDLARRWRDDEEYPAVCREILETVYPESLRGAVPDPVNDIADAKRWFASRTGGGESAARKMAHTYKLIAEADPSKTPEVTKTTNRTRVTA